MKYGVEDITKDLKAARQGKQLTQRGLSALAGVPQAHISKIESGAVDLKLSSLIELARVLDLELVLVPRKLVPAVEAIVRGHRDERSPAAHDVARELRRLRDALRHLRAASLVNSDGISELQKAVRELTYLRLGPAEAELIRKVLAAVRQAEKQPGQKVNLSAHARALRDLRNRFVHEVEPASGPRPAYTLDDEDDDA